MMNRVGMKESKDLTERLIQERIGASSNDALYFPLLLGHHKKSCTQFLRSTVKREQ